MLFFVLIILYILLAIIMVFSLLINGVRPSKTLGWLLAIFTIPIGGILFYLLLGRNRRKNKLLILEKQAFISRSTPFGRELDNVAGKHQKIMHLIYKNCHFPPTAQNELSLLKDGKVTFETIFEALEKANSYVHLQYYIFEEGVLANKLLNLFKKKIAEGVKVKMIYDGIGSYSLSKSYIKNLKAIGVEVFPFLPFRFGRFLSSLNYRNHRKIIVVDGEVAFTGGINISDKYLKGDPELGKWHDMHLRIKGAAANHLDNVFAMDWFLVCNQKINPQANKKHPLAKTSNAVVQIVSSGPDDDFATIEQVYFSIINKAKEYIYITNPYIIPGQAMMTALQTAALSGIDVRLLLSGNADSKIVNWTVRSYFEPLLKSGVKIYLFMDGFLHSKIVISDNEIATIGTANIDDRSFEQNYEVNAVIYDPAFATLLKEDFIEDSRESKELHYLEFKKRPWIDKLKEGVAKIFSPVL